MKTFLFQGDSITDAGRDRNNNNSYGAGYPNTVASVIGAKHPGEFRFINKGVSGDRTVDMYARIKRDCINFKPDYLTILIGVNDVWHEFHECPNGVDNDKYYKMFCMFIEEVLHFCPDVKIAVLEPFVLKGAGTQDNWNNFRTEVEKRAVSAKAVAEKYGLEFIPLQDKFDAAVSEKTPANYWLCDGVHPTAAGHGLIASEIINKFGF